MEDLDNKQWNNNKKERKATKRKTPRHIIASCFCIVEYCTDTRINILFILQINNQIKIC